MLELRWRRTGFDHRPVEREPVNNLTNAHPVVDWVFAVDL
jgi:hypothetical protein